MYWDDFKAFLQRNATPNAILKFYPPSKTVTDKITICDFNSPRRSGFINYAGKFEEEWFAQTQVGVGSWFNGEIPIYNWAGEPEHEQVIKRTPCRGALAVVEMLVDAGTLDLTDEIWSFIKEHKGVNRADKRREVARSNCSGMYIRSKGAIA